MKRASIAMLAAILVAGCGSDAPTESARTSTDAAAGPAFQPTTDVKQLMNWILDPNADVVWDAVGTIITDQGSEDIRPETDEQWTAIRNSAAMIAESGNLLMMPPRARDQDDWAKHSQAMIKAAQEALAAAEAKDADALFTAGSDVYLACSGCHAQYALELQRPE